MTDDRDKKPPAYGAFFSDLRKKLGDSELLATVSATARDRLAELKEKLEDPVLTENMGKRFEETADRLMGKIGQTLNDPKLKGELSSAWDELNRMLTDEQLKKSFGELKAQLADNGALSNANETIKQKARELDDWLNDPNLLTNLRQKVGGTLNELDERLRDPELVNNVSEALKKAMADLSETLRDLGEKSGIGVDPQAARESEDVATEGSVAAAAAEDAGDPSETTDADETEGAANSDNAATGRHSHKKM